MYTRTVLPAVAVPAAVGVLVVVAPLAGLVTSGASVTGWL